jgi:hypothetical protein
MNKFGRRFFLRLHRHRHSVVTTTTFGSFVIFHFSVIILHYIYFFAKFFIIYFFINLKIRYNELNYELPRILFYNQHTN